MNPVSKYGMAAAAALTLAFGTSHASETLTICGAPLPPYSYLKDGVATGIDVDVAKIVFGELGVPVNIVIEPFARCQQSLKTGDADLGFAISDVLDRHEYLYFPQNYVWQISYVFFTNKSTQQHYTIHNLDDAKRAKLRIGIVRGAAYYPDFWAAFPAQDKAVNEGYNDILTPATDTAANFRRLDLNFVQLFPQDRVAGIWAAKLVGEQHPYYYDDVLFTKNYTDAFSKASHFASDSYPNIEALVRAFDDKLGAFKQTVRYKQLFDNATQGAAVQMDDGGDGR
jgi:polar amino acid transport system substrate-binding protein